MELLQQHFDTAFAAPDGIKKLRELILTLAMQGKLVPQDKSAAQSVKLKEITSKIGSGSTPSGGKNAYKTSGIPLIRSMNVHFGGFRNEGLAFIDQVQADKLKNVTVQESDVLLNITGASIGRVTTAPKEMESARVNQHVCIIRAKEKVLPKFLEFYLSSPVFQDFVSSNQVGATREALTKAMIEDYQIILPSLSEQHRIVAKIDQLMARCDELEKLRTDREQQRLSVHTAAIRQLLDAPEGSAWDFIRQHFGELYSVKENVAELRKAILQLAVMGKLVPQDPNDIPARDILNGLEISNKIKANDDNNDAVPYDLPKNWEWTKTGNVGAIKLGRQRSPKDHFGPHMTPYLRVANVHDNRIDISDVKQMNFTPDERETFRLVYGDILLNEGQSKELVGRPAIYRDEVPGACFQNTLLRFRTYKGLLPEYALLYFRYCLYSGRFQQAVKQTTNMAHLSAGRLIPIEFPLPPFEEQKRIVAKIDQLMSLCDALDQQIEAATCKQTELLNAIMSHMHEANAA